MSTKPGKYFFVMPLLFLMVACAQLDQREIQNANDKEIVQNAKTYSDHNKLANHYDTVAKEMVAKAKEKKESLEEYNDHSYYYGRQGKDFKSHTVANIRYYEQAAQEATKQADYHRTIAAELLKQEHAKPAETPDQQVNRKIKARLNSDSSNLVE